MTYDPDHVVLEAEEVTNVSSTNYPFHAANGHGTLFGLEGFKQKMQIKIWWVSPNEMEFDLIGCDASLANAFRRILIAEVPTMAIEQVFVMNNTGIVQDEVLAQRLGLVPIKADPELFNFKTAEDSATDLNTIVFRLHVQCRHNPESPSDSSEPHNPYINADVMSGDLVWEPKGTQEERFQDDPIRPVLNDILLAKLRPGQEINCELHCHKGIGKTHAKWSPVATASYRLLPHIVLKKEITGELAEKLQKCFPPGVIELENKDGKIKAKVACARKDTMSREVLRHPEFKGLVELKRMRDHFIFRIESTGVVPPSDLLLRSIKVLKDKCIALEEAIARVLKQDEAQ
ncbi:DNA-directed RNA polymerase core subunit rpc40 [Dispira simplex]|nr:DNA-directed RNA polymerase core subunit rpc40 [Dispira simplex]